MNGIEILSTNAVDDFRIVPFMIIVFVGVVAMVVLDCIANDSLCEPPISAAVGVFLGMILYVIIFHVCIPTTHTEYKITISENVSMTEFYEKYEILNVDGQIYTVRERETE